MTAPRSTAWAHALLDAARKGEPASTAEINRALAATGDIEAGAYPVQTIRPAGTWERDGARLMARASWIVEAA